MDGIGVPLVTPFDADGEIDEAALREAASWVVERGVDFVVPCGSTGESELMTLPERARVTEVVADAVSVPVLAGTGHPGLAATREQTARAAAAGADAALVVTPFYYGHDQAAFEAYYRELAAGSDLPVYLYSVPPMTHTRLAPETVGALADHPNVAGLKDSGGDLTALQRERRLTGPDFDLLVGTGSLLGPALDVGADGGILALANVVPDLVSEVLELHRRGDREAARALHADLVELDVALTSRHAIPAVKAAMRHRGAPAGRPRAPHRPADESAVDEVTDLVDAALAGRSSRNR